MRRFSINLEWEKQSKQINLEWEKKLKQEDNMT